jgi:hypothetical protein
MNPFRKLSEYVPTAVFPNRITSQNAVKIAYLNARVIVYDCQNVWVVLRRVHRLKLGGGISYDVGEPDVGIVIPAAADQF